VLGPAIVESAAIAGSDPYFFTGTDVAVLFESRQPAALETLLIACADVAASQQSGAKPVAGESGARGIVGLVVARPARFLLYRSARSRRGRQQFAEASLACHAAAVG
jgi:hypothetical protein